MRKFITLACTCLLALNLRAGHDHAWDKLNAGDLKGARAELEKALADGATTEEVFSLILINMIEDRKESMNLVREFYDDLDNLAPYLYAVGFSDALMEGGSKLSDDRFDYFEQLLEDPNIHYSLKASVRDLLSMHYQRVNKYKDAVKNWDMIPAIRQWQVTGAFDNTSGSGFDKTHGPVENAGPDARFISATNSNVHWFTPGAFADRIWMHFGNNFSLKSQGLLYAQTFVTADADKTCTLSLGAGGSMKIWVNDELIFLNEEEVNTDVDLFNLPVKLSAGVNRILVQVGYTGKVEDPNFCIRLHREGEPVEGLTVSPVYQPYNTGSKVLQGDPIPHFAEKFFEDQLAADPNNQLAAILLARSYNRADRHNEAIALLRSHLKNNGGNLLMQYELLESYLKMDDRTEMLKQMELIRGLQADLPFIIYYDYQLARNREDYKEAERLLEKIGEIQGFQSVDFLHKEILLLADKEDYNQLFDKIESAYARHPEEFTFLELHYRILEQANRKAEGIWLLERYASKNYFAKLQNMLFDSYEETNNVSKAKKLLRKQHEQHPYDLEYLNKLKVYYYNVRDYRKSLEMAELGLTLAPFNASQWSDKAYIAEANGDDELAIQCFQSAIHFDPNMFTAREKLRELSGKTPITSLVLDDDVDGRIREAMKRPTDSDENYEFLFRERNYVIYPEGASLEISLLAIRPLNESGVKEWQEASIGYNYGSQRLVVNRAEAIKVNGQKVQAERNGNQLVFPSLEVGDVIYIEYRLDNYARGKLAKEFWLDNVFNSFAPMHEARLRIYCPEGTEFNIHNLNLPAEPTKTTVDDFVCYDWSYNELEQCKDENYMPSLREVGQSISLSTIKSWSVISDWYRDLAVNQAKEDYNLNVVYDSILGNKEGLTDEEKARVIYNFILDHVRYSSVSFRQSNYIPQKPMKTISTRLGDCKDMSTLYYTLARKAGLNTHLVLVSTRDNGEEMLKVPSPDFNHCIVRIDLPDRVIYQELTDEKLPFGAMPNNLLNSQALVIPNSVGEDVGKDLIHIPNNKMVPSNMHRKVLVKLDGDDNVNIDTRLEVYGDYASSFRHHYTGITATELDDQIKGWLGNFFDDSSVKLDSIHQENFDNRKDTLALTTMFSVDQAVKSIGGLKAIKLPLFEVIASMDAFPDKERKFDFCYWSYEQVPHYHTEVEVELPEGAAFAELPKGAEINNEKIRYSLKITRINARKVKVVREVTIDNSTVKAADYAAFRDLIKQVVKAEDSYLAYRMN